MGLDLKGGLVVPRGIVGISRGFLVVPRGRMGLAVQKWDFGAQEGLVVNRGGRTGWTWMFLRGKWDPRGSERGGCFRGPKKVGDSRGAWQLLGGGGRGVRVA